LEWKDFLFGAAVVLGIEFLLVIAIGAILIWRSERKTKKLLQQHRDD